MIASAHITITDLFDPIQGDQPTNPVEGMLWLDSSVTPNTIKRWDGSNWIQVGGLDDQTLETTVETIVQQKLTSDAIVSSVVSSTSYKQSFNSGRNYVIDSAETLYIEDGKIRQDGRKSNRYEIDDDLYSDSENGNRMLISFDIKRTGIETTGTSYSQSIYAGIFVYYKNSGSTSGSGYRMRSTDASFIKTDSDWVRIKFGPFSLKEYNPTSIEYVAFELANTFTGLVAIRNVKIEVSESWTSWRPSNADLSSLTDRVSSAEQKITADAIVSTVTSSQTYKTLESSVSTAQSTANTAKSTADSAASAASSAQSSITQLAGQISTKVSAGDIASTINQTAQSVKIDASKIQIGAFTYGNADKNGGVPGALYCGGRLNETGTSTGISANNADWAFWAGSGTFRVAQSGYLYAVNAYIAGTLAAGGWVFGPEGSKYSSNGVSVQMTVLSGGSGMVGGGSNMRAFYASSNCDVQYGSDYNYNALIRAKNVKIISQVGSVSDYRSAEFKKIDGANDMTFVCGEAGGIGDSSGNIGCSDQVWDTVYCRKVWRSAEGSLSSREIKKDIVDMPDMGNIIDMFSPVLFRYNWEDESHPIHHGLIYEDVKEFYPEICIEPDASRGETGVMYTGIDYSELITVLLKETQNLRKRVATLEAKGA